MHVVESSGVENFLTAEELGQLGNLKVKLIEVCYFEVEESRSVDLGHEVLQILGNASESKLGEGRKNSSGEGRGMSRRRSTRGRLESNQKGFQPCQRAQTYIHRHGRNITSLRYPAKSEFD